MFVRDKHRANARARHSSATSLSSSPSQCTPLSSVVNLAALCPPKSPLRLSLCVFLFSPPGFVSRRTVHSLLARVPTSPPSSTSTRSFPKAQPLHLLPVVLRPATSMERTRRPLPSLSRSPQFSAWATPLTTRVRPLSVFHIRLLLAHAFCRCIPLGTQCT